MKHIAAVACTVALLSSAAHAGNYTLQRLLLGPAVTSQSQIPPVPDVVGDARAVHPVMPAPVVAVPYIPGPAVAAHAEPLFRRVKYKDLDEVAPCHTSKIISVKNPCKRCFTDPDCVNIKICVPENCCDNPRVRSILGGKRVRYDYGKYAVDVRVKRDYIEVDYQD